MTNTAKRSSSVDGSKLLAPAADVRASTMQLVERFRPEEAQDLAARWVVDIAEHSPTTIHVRDGRCLISAGAVEDADATIRTDRETWLNMVAGRENGIQAFLDGRLQIDGDLNLAVRLETLFAPGPETTRPLRTMHTTVRGTRIESMVSGMGTPVIFLHGLAANKVSFLPTFGGLSDSFEVHALDLPGFGKSDKPFPRGKRYSPAWMAEIVHGYLIANQLRDAYLVGNSMGGRIAVELALQHPGSVRGLVTLGSAVAFDEWQRLSPVFRTLRTHWVGLASLPIPQHWIEQAMGELLFHDPSALAPANMRAGAKDVVLALQDRGYRLAVTACARHLLAERGTGRKGFWPRLESLSVPSFWVWGESDRLVSCRYAERVRERLPHAQVEVWDRIGHVPQFEAPQRTTTAIREFLERVEAGR